MADRDTPTAPAARFAFRYHYVADLVRATVYSLSEHGLQGLCGSLVMTKPEWHAFYTALVGLGDESEIEVSFEYEGEVR